MAKELSEPLSLESTLQNNSFGKSGAFSFKPEQNLELSKNCGEDLVVISPETGSCEDLQDDGDSRYFCSSIENFCSLTPVDDQTSIYETIPSSGTRKSTHERTELAKEGTSSRAGSLCFVELATTSSNDNSETETRNRVVEGHVETDLTGYALNSTQEQSFPRSKVQLGWPQEMNSGSPFQNSAWEIASQPAMFPQSNMDVIQAKSSDSRLSQCSIPVWVSGLKWRLLG